LVFSIKNKLPAVCRTFKKKKKRRRRKKERRRRKKKEPGK